MKEEPSVLDYVKWLFSFKRHTLMEIPPLDEEKGRLFGDGSIEGEMESRAPVVSVPFREKLFSSLPVAQHPGAVVWDDRAVGIGTSPAVRKSFVDGFCMVLAFCWFCGVGGVGERMGCVRTDG
jgi:hypothetical protein